MTGDGEGTALGLDLEAGIPEASPSAFATPTFSLWHGMAASNRKALEAPGLRIGSVLLAELRRRARIEIAALGVEYTEGLGVEFVPGGNGLLICTGHQPLLVHPGIWIKHLSLARLVPPDGSGVSVVVDSDASEEVVAEVPARDGRLRRHRVRLVGAEPEVPFELMAATSEEGWRRFVREVDDCLEGLGEEAIASAWSATRDAPPPTRAHGLSGAVTAARRRLEGRRPYVEVPVSWIARTSAFRTFVLSIVREAERFAGVHNAALSEYRLRHGIRTGAQPFPDLDVAGSLVEAPFWLIHGGVRTPLYVDLEDGRFWANGQELGNVPDDPDAPGLKAMAIRPRAVSLTAFLRLALADLFIHGVGGGRYDRATDAIIRRFFGIEPPAYSVATATLFLPFSSRTPDEGDLQRLRRLHLDLQHNPDRFLAEGEGRYRALTDEKWELIRRLEGAAEMTRRQRREVTGRIREINLELQPAVSERLQEAARELREAERRQAEAEAIDYRGYPFLLHPVESVEALVDALAAGDADAGAVRP